MTGKENNAFDFERPPTFFATFSFPFGLLSEISRGVDIKEVIETINRMQGDGVIDRYAIGGAVGATFYLEPVATLDLDIFVAFKGDADTIIVSPEPIYDYLKSKGCTTEGEYIVIAGWPVQFLPCRGSLLEEALAQAVEKDVDGVRARVFTAEHLAAIALQTGRGKDKARLLQFIEADAIDKGKLREIMARHGLLERWQQFERQFLT